MQQYIMAVGQKELHLTQIAFRPRLLGEGEIADIDVAPIDLTFTLC